MATTTLKGVNRTYRTASPPTKIPAGEERGKVHVYYDEYTYAANSVINDVITMMTLPKNFRVHGAYMLSTADQGSNGTMSLGNAVSADALEAVSATSLINQGVYTGTGGNCLTAAGGVAGAGVAPGTMLGRALLADVDIKVLIDAASDAGTGFTIKVAVWGAFD